MIRLGVVACIALAAVIGGSRLDETLGLFDYRADRNASLSYLARVHADEGVSGSQDVVQDAAAWMPNDASYRVVIGPHLRGVHRFTRPLAKDFLKYFLYPRRQTTSTSAPWLFCYGCDLAALEGRFQVLSDGDNGILFGRVHP